MSTLLISANIIGYIGAIILWFQVVFGSRHIFKYLTHDTVVMNRWHKQVGIYGILFIAAHPLLEMMSRLENLLWLFTPDFVVKSATYVTYGKIAFTLFLVVWITSAMVRESLKWEPWKYLHLLSYVVLSLVFLHITYIGTFFENYIVVKVLWLTMLVLFITVTFLRLLAWASVTKDESPITDIKVINDTIMLLRFKPKTPIDPSIGQHIYLQSGPFKNEHPFTIMETHKEKGEILLGIRKLGGLWDELMTKKVGDSIFIDGPYGVFTKEAQNTNPKVIISGGIGVTPFVDLVRNFGENTTYINCNRSVSDAVSRDMLKDKATKYVDVVDSYSGHEDSSVIVGRISKDVIASVVGPNIVNLPYFICGSPMFITIVCNMLKEAGVKKSNIFYEELGF